MLGGECHPCCSGPSLCNYDFTNAQAIAVNISGGRDVYLRRWLKNTGRGGVMWEKVSSYVSASAFNGRHLLERTCDGGAYQFRKSFPAAQDENCVAVDGVIEFRFLNRTAINAPSVNVWGLRLSFTPSYLSIRRAFGGDFPPPDDDCFRHFQPWQFVNCSGDPVAPAGCSHVLSKNVSFREMLFIESCIEGVFLSPFPTQIVLAQPVSPRSSDFEIQTPYRPDAVEPSGPQDVTLTLESLEIIESTPSSCGLLVSIKTSCNAFGGFGGRGIASANVCGNAITGASVSSGGSGYAKLGRREPTLSIAGMAATFSLLQQAGACGLPYWKIDSISVPSGVGGFTDGQAVTVSAIAGDTVEVAAQCTVETERAEPALTASASPGTGAVFSVEMADNEDGTWRVSAVTFTGTTVGYEDGGYLSFSGTSVTEEEAAAVMIVTGRDQPEMSLEVYSWGGGAGAVLTPTVSTNGGTPETWGISAVAIDNGGEGYSPGDDVYATGGIAEPFSEFYGSVASVDENGAITGVHIYYGGMYYETNGVIDSLYVVGGGRYYIDQVAAIVVVNGGRYYREDAALMPFVSATVASIEQGPSGSGAGAVLDAVVDSGTGSPTFGQVVALNVISGGVGYRDFDPSPCPPNPFP